MRRELKEGAVIVTDSHFPRHADELLALIEEWHAKPPPQVIFLGDVCEFLSAYIPYSVTYNQRLIDAINKLSKQTNVIYLEGNHDFLIAPLFPHVDVISLPNQPVSFYYGENKTAVLLHGDRFENAAYMLYATVLRNRLLLLFLRIVTIDIRGRFMKKIYAALAKKKICQSIDGFAEKKRAQLRQHRFFNADLVIEGHYHQRLSLQEDERKYEALGAFACTKSFFRVEFSQGDARLIESKRGAPEDVGCR